MNTLIATIVVLVVVSVIMALVYVIVHYRHQLANFLRAATNPPYNNWVLLGLWIGVVILFCLAVFIGGGEPFGLSLLREATNAHRPSTQADFYNPLSSRELFSRGYQTPVVTGPQGTWVVWYLFFAWLFIATVFIPIAFHDEIGNAWHRAWDRIEQRERRARLQRPVSVTTPPRLVTATTAGTTVPTTFWNRLNQRLAEHLPADVIGEFINDFIGAAFRAIFRR